VCREHTAVCLFRNLNVRVVTENFPYCTKSHFFPFFFFFFFNAISALSLSLEQPDLSYFEPRADAGNREGMLKVPQEELPFKFLQRPCASGGAGAGRSLPSHVFQPAVLLSPPRQKSSQELSPLQNGEISGCSRLESLCSVLLFQSRTTFGGAFSVENF